MDNGRLDRPKLDSKYVSIYRGEAIAGSLAREEVFFRRTASMTALPKDMTGGRPIKYARSGLAQARDVPGCCANAPSAACALLIRGPSVIVLAVWVPALRSSAKSAGAASGHGYRVPKRELINARAGTTDVNAFERPALASGLPTS